MYLFMAHDSAANGSQWTLSARNTRERLPTDNATDKGHVMTDTASEKVAYTINECCALYHIGRTHYYALQASGDGPIALRAGPRKVLITRRSAEAWEWRFERQPANDDSDTNQATG